MSIISGVALAGLLLMTEQGGSDLILRHDFGTRYTRTDYETACGTTVFQVRFRNGPEERGRVDRLLIDGRPVRDAAETLQIRAARRGIDSIGIMNCGMDPHRPIFRGVMNLSEMESRAESLRPSLYFRIIRRGGDWQMILD